jgi:glycerol-1-phosphate dehydrogenase [NAD(P)+]
MILDPVFAASAPEGLSASGYADMIAKVPAGSDWMLAAAVGAEKIDDFSFGLVQDGLKDMLAQSAEIAAHDIDATEKLAEGLIMSGFAMQALQSSRPASGMEHQFSHYWDMDGLCMNGKHVSHGFKVGIGTLVSTACQEFLLRQDIEKLDAAACAARWPSWEETEQTIRRIFAQKPAHAERALSESRAKYSDKEEVAGQIRALQAAWPRLKKDIAAQIYTFDQVKNHLKTVGAPYEPEMIGISRARLKETFKGIPYMRSRFTSIDILHRCGLLPQVEEVLFGKGGIWEV